MTLAASARFDTAGEQVTSNPIILAFVEEAFYMSASVIGPTPESIT